MNANLKPGAWALLRVKDISNKNMEASANRTRLDVKFESVANPSESFWDEFYLSEKAINRLAALASRSGVERECKKAADVSMPFVAELLGKQVWAMLCENRYGPAGSVKTDGWKFRSTAEPPEEELSIDYQAMDEEEIAFEGI